MNKIWKIVAPDKRFFTACFGSNFQVSNLILKASLTYFIQYFASTYEVKRKAMIMN